MNPENFYQNYKIITTEEGAKKIFPSDEGGAEEIIDKAIEAYKKFISNNVEGATFTFFSSNNKSYVLIFDSQGEKYLYYPESNTIKENS